MEKSTIKREVDYWIERFQLEEKRHAKAETLSKGNQQKVQLIASFLHQPPFLILDEPFSGLDPVNKELLKSAILELKQRGTTILFSSHQMENVEELCDNLCLMKNGRALFTGAIIDLKKKHGKKRLAIRTELTPETLLKLDGVESCVRNGDELVCSVSNEEVAKTVYDLVSNDGFVEKFSLDYLSLDEIFRLEVGGYHE
jgi:ABC-2 type transport system ATP-binding protein